MRYLRALAVLAIGILVGIYSSDVAKPKLVALAQGHYIQLTWTPCPGGCAGYNVYRSTTSGSGYTKLGSCTATTLNDSTGSLVAGTTYYYVVRSVDAAGNEAANSPEAHATQLAPLQPVASLTATAK